MKKFISVISILILASVVFSTSAIAASGTADASVTCDGEKAKVARAVGENAKVTASCGPKTKKPKASKPAATPSSSSSNAAAVSALAHENASLKASASASSTTGAIYVQSPANGQEVCDSVGNCSRTTQGGSMLCNNKINGKIVEQDFAPLGLTQEQARSYCRASGDRFLAAHQSTTPALVATATASGSVSASAVATASTTSNLKGKFPCNLKFDGKIVEQDFADDQSACTALNNKKAAEKGWIAAK